MLPHQSILESKDFYPLSFDKRRPLPFILIPQDGIVRRAIQFDSNVAVRAEKVDDKATYAVLSSELFSEELASLEVLPQDGLSSSRLVSQFFTTGFEVKGGCGRGEFYPSYGGLIGRGNSKRGGIRKTTPSSRSLS
jgi:hypothetical protein